MNRERASFIALIAAVVMGFTALFIEPPGEIDDTVIYFALQLIIFSATMLGVSMHRDDKP